MFVLRTVGSAAASTLTYNFYYTVLNQTIRAAILNPAKFVFETALTLTASAATFFTIAALKVGANATLYLVSNTVNGAHYLLFHPTPQPLMIEALRDPKDLSKTNDSAWDLLEDSP